ncbi:hypothetical protein LDENG_00268880 [Lucifuga dentata]|nr:hypothetical protein LDENG_00268880 [Lucifuga dentata]
MSLSYLRGIVSLSRSGSVWDSFWVWTRIAVRLLVTSGLGLTGLQQRAEGMCSLWTIRKIPALTFNIKLFLAFLQQCAVVPSQSSALPANQSGVNLVLFGCKHPGCANNVTKIYCGDLLIFYDSAIRECTGIPAPNTACQHDGRAYLAIDKPIECDFEGDNGYVETTKYSVMSNISAIFKAIYQQTPTIHQQTTIPSANSNSTTQTNTAVGCTVVALVVLGILGFIVVCIYCKKTKQNTEKNAQPTENHDETVYLSILERQEDSSERAFDDGPTMEDGALSPQCDHGV